MISEPMADVLEKVYILGRDSENRSDKMVAAIVSTVQGANYNGTLPKLLESCRNFILEELSRDQHPN